MKGNLIIDKISDPKLRQEWAVHLTPLYKALKNLVETKVLQEDRMSELEYLEAAMQFIEARDRERTFFWDTFMQKVNEESDQPAGVS
jgi:hypothetical protein